MCNSKKADLVIKIGILILSIIIAYCFVNIFIP
jgi:hypothetical protein